MYIDRIHIKDLRCFAETTIEFEHPDVAGPERPLPNVTLLLGNNGVGKTTVLRAVALGALSIGLNHAGYVPYSMVRRARVNPPSRSYVLSTLVAHHQDFAGEISRVADRKPFDSRVDLVRRGSVETFTGTLGRRMSWASLEDQIYSDESPGVLVLGYGATRRVDPPSEFSPGRRRKQYPLRYERVVSLFEDQVALVPLAGWLPEMVDRRPKLSQRVFELLEELIPADTKFTGKLVDHEYLFDRCGVKVDFAALSDGYRGYIGLLGDMFYHICRGLRDGQDPTDSRGIILIDEIDQHLHPAWQRVVIPTLAKTLPKLQFILTTHSPIVAGTVYARNIRLLETDEHGLSRLEPLDEEVHGLNADQVLLTEAFGLSSSRAPDFVEKYEQATRDLDPDNWKDALELMRMINRGSAGVAEVEEPSKRKPKSKRSPGTVRAEDRPAPKPTKKPGKKKSSKKSSR